MLPRLILSVLIAAGGPFTALATSLTTPRGVSIWVAGLLSRPSFSCSPERSKRNPARARAREGEPRPEVGLGEPPPHFLIPEPQSGFQRAARLREIWEEIASMAVWLTIADRHTVEDICELRLKARAGFIKPGERSTLARLNNACGLDPSGRVKLPTGIQAPAREDPRDAFLKRKHG